MELINNLLGSYEHTFDELLRNIEYRDNRVYNLDTSYKNSLEIRKELEGTIKASKELEGEIEEKSKEYKKACNNELDL